MNVLTIFYTFCRYSLLAFGGGYMLIPMLIADFVGEDKFLAVEQFGNLVSIQQLTPGPVGLNTATYTGYTQCGFLGALAATCGMFLPTLFLASAAVSGIRRWKEYPLIKSILKHSRLAAVSMILYAVTVFWGMSIFTAPIPWRQLISQVTSNPLPVPENFGISGTNTVICIVCFFVILRTKIPTTYIILQSAAVGAVLAVI